MKDKVYISGQMSGLSVEDYTKRFNDAEAILKEKGYKVMNPVRWGWFLKHVPYRFALAFDLLLMCFCQRVYMLDGWTLSDGATAENQFARSVGLIIEYER